MRFCPHVHAQRTQRATEDGTDRPFVVPSAAVSSVSPPAATFLAHYGAIEHVARKFLPYLAHFDVVIVNHGERGGGVMQSDARKPEGRRRAPAGNTTLPLWGILCVRPPC